MKKLHIAFLWHQHQPMYKNPSTGIYELPWVRLHATKDYYDTIAILDEFPKIRSNFNFVPSLLMQLEDYASGKAHDKFLDLTLKNAEDLSQEDKIFILFNFFMANWDTMVHPYPRYSQLLEKRGRTTSKDELKRTQGYFKAAEMRDLQVWFNLSWMDPYWKEHDPFIQQLCEKGKNFTEEDKQTLVKKQLEICGMVVSKAREVQDRGQIEVSTTPFYHPILPLLCDTNNALIASPHMTLPKKRFQHCDDARHQVEKAVAMYTKHFGKAPRGMWPAEGSVAEEIVPVFASSGVNWIATDQDVLFHTLGNADHYCTQLYQPYNVNILDHSIKMVFRDHALSDSIGFVYARWDPHAAASDFMRKLHGIRSSLAHAQGEHLVTIILDGENCWEYYKNDGWDFLRALYSAISNDPCIETVTISDYLERNPPKETLHRLWAGSWINGNFNIWIGHPEDNTAWEYLADTRKFLADYVNNNLDKKDTPNVLAAWERIFIAEGSDWNWWYGDDHSSDNDEMFDLLFRQNLINVYELLGAKIPANLYKPIKGLLKKKPTLEPVDFITPKIDGKVSSYFEWLAAGYYEVGHTGGSMHQVDTLLRAFYYGFDLNNIYLRLDLTIPLASELIKDICIKLNFLTPAGHEAIVCFEAGGNLKEFILRTPSGFENLKTAAAQKIIEIAIPLAKMELPQDPSAQIEFVIAILKNGSEVERWPNESTVSFPIPSEEYKLRSWSV